MAQDIVQSLFGLTPFQTQQAQTQDLGTAADAYARQDPFQRASGQLYRAGGMLAGPAMESMGFVNPAVEQAKAREQALTNIDLSNSDAILRTAMRTQDPRMKVQLTMMAQQRKAQEQKARMDAAETARKEAQTERELAMAEKALRDNPNLAVTEVGVEGRPGWMRKVLYNKTNPSAPMQQIGDPYMSAAAAKNEFKVELPQPVTPVTVQDPKNPDATIIIDGRSGRVIGSGPKLTETGKMNVKKQSSMEGLSSDLQEAEDLLTGAKTGSKPTSSGIGSAYDVAASWVGATPEGAAEADALKVVAGRLVQKVPRFEGPQSDKDVALYKQMAADAGNEKNTLPRRLAAVRQMRKIYEGYETGEKGRIGGNTTVQPPTSGRSFKVLGKE
jgi:hypothetical protein